MSLLSKKFPTLLGLLILIGAVAAYIYFVKPQLSTQSSPDIVPTKVRITNIADNKFSVSWITKTAQVGEVEYGQVGEKITTKGRDDRDTSEAGKFQAHHVTIEGLQPNTQYAFRILSGDKLTRFDNNGSPYNATTGPVIGETPSSQNFYGVAQLPSKKAADGTLVYLTLPGASTVSTIVNGSGNYAFTLSTIRKADLRSYIEFDPSATIASLTVESGSSESVVSVSLANSDPVPTITLGENADFVNQAQKPNIAEIKPEESPNPTTAATASPSPSAQTPSIFNVEPLSGSDINSVTSNTVTLLNPKDDGETLSTLKPEFRGTGPAGISINISLTGQKAITDSTTVATDSTWTWSPAIDLKVGKQKITLTYTPTGGSKQTLSRNFTIAASANGLDPAFVSTPSASIKASAIPSISPTVKPSPREAMPATDSGVPVTGVIENTLLTGTLGIVIMVIGAALLSL